MDGTDAGGGMMLGGTYVEALPVGAAEKVVAADVGIWSWAAATQKCAITARTKRHFISIGTRFM
jgi:hypothetical protein